MASTEPVHGITQHDLDNVAEIIHLHDEALEHALKIDDYHKSSEGAVSLEIPPYFEREPGFKVAVSVYSYVLGPSRMHDFDTSDEALEAVRRWHAQEFRRHPDWWASGVNDG